MIADQTIFEIALKMHALAFEIVDISDKNGDGVLRDIGFSILDQSREMVRDHLAEIGK